MYHGLMSPEQIKAALKELRWTQKKLGERIGCNETTVGRWCRGEVPVPGVVAEYLRVMKVLKDALG
jgi:transcriptional regulator with XRE-family HTH domain